MHWLGKWDSSGRLTEEIALRVVHRREEGRGFDLLDSSHFYWSKFQGYGLPWTDWWRHPNSSVPQFSPSSHSSLVLQWVFFLKENYDTAMPQDKILLLLWISGISTDNPVIQFKAFLDILYSAPAKFSKDREAILTQESRTGASKSGPLPVYG